jgi:hypothetical protein
MTIVDLRKLLQKVETARVGSPQLDSEFANIFHSAPSDVTRSIDAAITLIERELPGWGWNCGCCEHRNGASLYVPGSSRIRGSFSRANGSRPEDLQLLQHPKWGTLFDNGFHCDRGGTVPLAMLTVFLEATIALMCARPVELPVSMNDRIVRRAWEVPSNKAVGSTVNTPPHKVARSTVNTAPQGRR